MGRPAQPRRLHQRSNAPQPRENPRSRTPRFTAQTNPTSAQKRPTPAPSQTCRCLHWRSIARCLLRRSVARCLLRRSIAAGLLRRSIVCWPLRRSIVALRLRRRSVAANFSAETWLGSSPNGRRATVRNHSSHLGSFHCANERGRAALPPPRPSVASGDEAAANGTEKRKATRLRSEKRARPFTRRRARRTARCRPTATRRRTPP